MARRLQQEEDARANASTSTPPIVTPAYYPTVPYESPVPFGPNTPTHAPSVGRALMDDVTPGFMYGVGNVPPTQPIPPQNGPGDYARPVPFGVPRGAYSSNHPVAAPIPYNNPYGVQPTSGILPPHLAPAEDDAALARRLQAEEDVGAQSNRANSHGNTPSSAPDASDDAALAAAMQAEEDSIAQTERVKHSNTIYTNPSEAADAALARKLQSEEDANAAASNGYDLLGRSNHNNGMSLFSSGVCPGCARPTSSFGPHIRTAGGKWHPSCFACGGCRRPISNGTHSIKDGVPYHTDCYCERFHPRCTVCAEKIPFEGGGTEGVVRWLSHPYWCDVTYCPSHQLDGTRKCDGCERVEPRDAGQEGNAFAELPDGRHLCLECASTAVLDTKNDGATMYDAVCTFMAEIGLPLVKVGGSYSSGTEHIHSTSDNLLWSDRPPLHLVSQDALDAADGKEQWHVGRTSRTRGLCLFSEHVINTVERVPRWDSNFAGGLFPVGFEERVVGSSRTGQSTVNAVVVLYGLPAIAFGAILAHECTHAYIRIKGGFTKLAPKVEEGLCQLIALLWVESVAAKGRLPGKEGAGRGGSDYQKGAPNNPSHNDSTSGWEESNLASMAGYVANQIRSDPSDVYGNGLRVALGAYQKVGLQAVFEHVRKYGTIPK